MATAEFLQQAAVAGALSVAERCYPRPRSGAEARRTPCPKGSGQKSYPTSEVRGSSRECHAATAQERPRTATQVRGQGQRPRVPGCNGAGTAEKSYLMFKVRGDGREELPHA